MMDHHCMWIDNCIGADNINYYFRFMTVGIIVYFIFFIAFLAHILLGSASDDAKGMEGFYSFIPFSFLFDE